MQRRDSDRRAGQPYSFIFSPLLFLDSYEAEILRSQLQRDRPGVAPTEFHGTRALRRGAGWAIELPVGTLSNNLREGQVQIYNEQEALNDLLVGIKLRTGRQGMVHKRQILRVADRAFFKRKALTLLVEQAQGNLLLKAALNFITYAERDPTFITGPKAPRRPFVPAKDRRVQNGHPVRGPSWTKLEDHFLQQFFSRQPDGTRLKMTEKLWQLLHDKLDGRRSRGAIRARLRVLNRRLKRELLVEGYLPTDKVKVYSSERLGQRRCVPRKRVMLDGTYGGLRPGTER